MTDLMQDVKELKAIRESVGLYSTSTIKSFLQDMIVRKMKEIAEISKADEERSKQGSVK